MDPSEIVALPQRRRRKEAETQQGDGIDGNKKQGGPAAAVSPLRGGGSDSLDPNQNTETIDVPAYEGERAERRAGNASEQRKYEYLDHTADVQFHSWGDNMEEAFEQAVVCMFSYITEIDTVDTTSTNSVEVSGHDLDSLLYAFMDEFLFQFCVDGFVARRVTITEFDKEAFTIKAQGFGEKFQPRTKHPQGTEIKAITYSAMQIIQHSQGTAELFVIVDI
eukprot:CAMPEP_0181292630 /NCGR_PEP_ID=MMETSP1101-20121128/2615_1 /TAXON_ID=46948 /ORGANISM="Rhodomonas abbreviata, Strain Caron Lab Isolate" /LENGTH=220 /DNA_ID=CAMNT_0023397125 /DNA_START=316 /DNA_END=978 /DNA_ORIENTATION=-